MDGRTAKVAEAERLVEVRLLEVTSRDEEVGEGAVHAEAGKNDSVGDVGVEVS